MLERLLDLGKSVLAESDLDRMLTAAIDGVIELCGAERGLILLFDPDRPGGEPVVETARNLEKRDLERPEFEVSRSILDRVRSGGELFWSQNVLDDPSLGHRASVLRLSILSMICQPIRDDSGRTLGVVYLDNRRAEGVFTEENARLVASFSDFISVAARNALQRRRLEDRIETLSGELRGRWNFEGIVGQDPRLLEVLRLVGQVADSEATILIQGESGTGKELVARALHANSHRRAQPFVAVNCGALPEALLESELFGHVHGAFTGAVRDNPGWFERAEGGTLLLDEVGELAPALQVKLLRVLESGEMSRVGSTRVRRANVRVVAATHRDLAELAREGRFREDFLYRLNVVEIRVPPLRERRSDLPLLIRHLLGRLAGEGAAAKRLSAQAESLLLAHSWPGNVRELRNALQRAVLLAETAVIEPRHLPESLRRAARPAAEEEPAAAGLSFQEAKRRAVERFEREYLAQRLQEAGGNIRRAARAANVDYKNFYTKVRRYGIDPHAFKGA